MTLPHHADAARLQARTEEELIARQRQTVRRWVCDSDPSRVEHTSFVGWTPCPSCRVIEAHAESVRHLDPHDQVRALLGTDTTPEAHT